MMCDEDVVTLLGADATRKKFMADMAGGRFQRHAAFFRFGVGLSCFAEMAVTQLASDLFHQTGVSAGSGTAQAVIQMADDEMSESQCA